MSRTLCIYIFVSIYGYEWAVHEPCHTLYEWWHTLGVLNMPRILSTCTCIRVYIYIYIYIYMYTHICTYTDIYICMSRILYMWHTHMWHTHMWHTHTWHTHMWHTQGGSRIWNWHIILHIHIHMMLHARGLFPCIRRARLDISMSHVTHTQVMSHVTDE